MSLQRCESGPKRWALIDLFDEHFGGPKLVGRTNCVPIDTALIILLKAAPSVVHTGLGSRWGDNSSVITISYGKTSQREA
jgi:hypothetical protein